MVAYRLDLSEGYLIDDKYKVVKKIGSGSYGDVFMVEDSFKQIYALKLLRLWEVSSDVRQNLKDRFELEYNTARNKSEYLVHTVEFGIIQGNPYFLMEYCEGGDLSSMIGKDLSSLPMIAYDILRGLYDLHKDGKIHRDLKPENVLIKKNKHAALTDFGVVRDKNSSKRLSMSGFLGRPKEIFGTYPYMAPEMSERKGGGVTYLETVDIFSFGVMMYEVLTSGILPFGKIEEQKDLPIYQDNIKKGIWNKSRLIETRCNSKWVSIIEKCLQADFRNRYQSVYEIIQDLSTIVDFDGNGFLEIQKSRSYNISGLKITQGQNVGTTYSLHDIMANTGRKMIRVGRESANDIVLPDNQNTYLSRYHFTLEYVTVGGYWLIKDGQYLIADRRWFVSTNGTFLNASPVSLRGLKLFTGDIITVGEYKLKVE